MGILIPACWILFIVAAAVVGLLLGLLFVALYLGNIITFFAFLVMKHPYVLIAWIAILVLGGLFRGKTPYQPSDTEWWHAKESTLRWQAKRGKISEREFRRQHKILKLQRMMSDAKFFSSLTPIDQQRIMAELNYLRSVPIAGNGTSRENSNAEASRPLAVEDLPASWNPALRAVLCRFHSWLRI
jgi:hypothetical protein